VRPEQLIVANNLTYEDGTVQKEGGAAKYNSTAITDAPSILGGHDWWPTESTQRVVVLLSDGKLRKDTDGGGFTVTLKSGLSVGDVIPNFVDGGKEAAAGNRKLFIFTQKNVVQVLSADGATTGDITTPPADWSGTNQPRCGVAHEGRIWGAGNANDPHRAYYSDTGDHEDFTGGVSGQISVYPGQGQYIAAMLSFRGGLLVFKYPRGIYLIDTSSTTVANWRVDLITDKIGSASPRAAVIIDNDIVVFDPSGSIHLVSAAQEFGDIATSDISTTARMDTWIRENLNVGQLALTQGIYDGARKALHFAAPGAGSTVNTRRLVLEFSDTIRFRSADRDTAVSMWMRRDTTTGVLGPVYGDNAGFMWLMDQDVRSKDGVGYNGEFQSPHYDLSHIEPSLGTVRKHGKALELVVEPAGNWNLNVDILWDGDLSETVTFNMGITGASLGSFVFGTDKLAGDQVITKRRRIVGSGHRISIVGRNSGAGENYSIGRFYLHFKAGEQGLRA